MATNCKSKLSFSKPILQERMIMDLAKLLTIIYIIIETVAAVPLGYSNHEDQYTKTGLRSLIKPLYAPIMKTQQFFGSFGNFFSPAVATPNTYEDMHVHNNHEAMYIQNSPKEPINNAHNKNPVTETVPSTLSRDHNVKNTIKKVEQPAQVDKEIIDKIFNDFKEVDQNSITTTEDTVADTTGTGDYETTTDYLLRIPAPVVATLLGK